MKIAGFFFSLMLCCQSLLAQDSTHFSYAEVTDTLVKQRFIDRYENVFMTKVPTRHMVKIGAEFSPLGFLDPGYGLQGLLLNIGYEFKLLPSVSLGVNFKANGGYSSSQAWGGVLAANFQGRWYFDMNQRIATGKSANNFSGNYLAVVGERYWQSHLSAYPKIKTGVEFGMQRRFFNNGAIDFAAGVYYMKYAETPSRWEYVSGSGKINEFEISTRTMLLFAFGDWKRKATSPACDVFRCDEFISSQWKFLWPVIRISSNISNIGLGAGYERKLGKSPFSVNVQIHADYNSFIYRDFYNSSLSRSTSVQLQTFAHTRYYLLQKRQIRKGRGGNNLSGFYVGPHVDYLRYRTQYYSDIDRKHLGVGFAYGYQKALFKNGY
ncbi:MAG TPA: hypothetical protein VGN64_04945, partial [Dyadobacter sp.]|nr:hypothetical protein [Dyadobacter sp.]